MLLPDLPPRCWLRQRPRRPNVPRFSPVAGTQLGYGVAALICHPDIGPVKGHAKRGAAHAEVAEVSSVAGTLGYEVGPCICYPDIGSIKSDAKRLASHAEVAEVQLRRWPAAWSRCCCPDSPPRY